MLSYRCETRAPLLKKLTLCDEQCYYIEDEDAEKLSRISPGLSRLVRDAGNHTATHFVCESCGQICPVKLQDLHDCRQA